MEALWWRVPCNRLSLITSRLFSACLRIETGASPLCESAGGDAAFIFDVRSFWDIVSGFREADTGGIADGGQLPDFQAAHRGRLDPPCVGMI